MSQTKNTKFKVGDRVFAKLKGYSYWPAIINSIDLKNKLPKYNVTFYGTGEIACVREIDVQLFLENKTRFGTTKLKNKNREIFLNAMKEVELSFSKASYAVNSSSISSVASVTADNQSDLSDDSAEPKSTNSSIMSDNSSISTALHK